MRRRRCLTSMPTCIRRRSTRTTSALSRAWPPSWTRRSATSPTPSRPRACGTTLSSSFCPTSMPKGDVWGGGTEKEEKRTCTHLRINSLQRRSDRGDRVWAFGQQLPAARRQAHSVGGWRPRQRLCQRWCCPRLAAWVDPRGLHPRRRLVRHHLPSCWRRPYGWFPCTHVAYSV